MIAWIQMAIWTVLSLLALVVLRVCGALTVQTLLILGAVLITGNTVLGIRAIQSTRQRKPIPEKEGKREDKKDVNHSAQDGK